MRKNLLAVLVCVIVATNFSNKCYAQSDLIYYWSFNVNDTTSPAFTRPGAGSANIYYYYGSGGYIDLTNPGTNLNAQTPDTSAGWSLRLRTPADSMIFHMPTTLFKNIQFSYATERSGSGPTPAYIYYSTDGTTFKPTCMADPIDSCVYTVSSTAYQLQTYNFSGDSTTNNNPNFAIKISYTNWTGAGNDRFDNVALKGDTMAANPSLGVNVFSKKTTQYTIAPNPAINNIEISAADAGSKTISITNVTGQLVFSTVASGNLIPVSVSGFSNGMYFINIRENESGNTTVLKFIKQ